MKPKGHSSERIRREIERAIPEIILKDLKKSSIGMVSVNEVVLNRDSSLAKIYVSFIGVKNQVKPLEELNRCKGVVRSLLAKRISVYKVPDLLFIHDEQFERADSLEMALKKEEQQLEEMKKN